MSNILTEWNLHIVEIIKGLILVLHRDYVLSTHSRNYQGSYT